MCITNIDSERDLEAYLTCVEFLLINIWEFALYWIISSRAVLVRATI